MSYMSADEVHPNIYGVQRIADELTKRINIAMNKVIILGINDITPASLGSESDCCTDIAKHPSPVSTVCKTFCIPNINPKGTPAIAFTGFIIPSIIPDKY